MSSRDLRLPLLAFAAFVLAAILMGVTLPYWPAAPSALLLALILVAMLSEALAVELASVHFSITYTVGAATTMLLGPLAGALAVGLSSIPPAFGAKDRRVIRGVFNYGQLTLASLAGGWAYVLAGGRVIAGRPLVAAEMPLMVLPILFLALATFVVNSALVGVAVSILSGARFRDVWKQTAIWTIPTEAALAVLALALAQVVASEGIVGLGLFVVPLMIARQFYERYVVLKRTYADTVRSLVAVVEAKDAYTRGHSERVAAYSVAIAQRLGLSDQRIERVELAALLHDLGKVGISRAILLKDSRLSDEEYELIKTHPDIGARIIVEVPFIADLAPFISSHHERVDGTGYSNQLEGEAIPIEARVLGVADAFDAMTSSRPYREAMDREGTIEELRRCAGQQFDEAVVSAFVDVLAADGLSSIPTHAEAADEAG